MATRPALSVKSRCMDCGLEISLTGNDAVQVVTAIDAAHDVMRPECPQAVSRHG